MATTNQNVTADALISATVKYSNKDDAARAYDITANVSIRDKNVTSFDNGEVYKSSSSTEGGVYAANFSSYSEKSLNLNVNSSDEEETKEIVSAIYAFMSDVRASVNANPVTA